jgi:hypothetical protein
MDATIGRPREFSTGQNPTCSTRIPGKIANAIVTGRIRNTSGLVFDLGCYSEM